MKSIKLNLDQFLPEETKLLIKVCEHYEKTISLLAKHESEMPKEVIDHVITLGEIND